MGVLSLSATATSSIQFLSSQQSPLLVRGVFPATTGGTYSISTRTRICSRQQRRFGFFRMESGVESSSTLDELQDFRVVPSNLLTAEREEAKAVLTMFLKKEIGLNNEAAAATLCKSVPFIDHLVARLHSIHKSRYLVGRELTTLEIRDAILPHLEYLWEEHGGSLDDVMENFWNPPEEEQKRHMSEASPTNLPLHSKKLEAMARMTKIGTNGQLHPNTVYLIDIGLDMDQIKEMARKYPLIIYERKIKPLVEFLLDVGVPLSDIPNILYRNPQLCSCSISKNIIPSMAYLETLGLDKSKWAKVIHRCPRLLTRSRQKMEATVDYLYELGLSGDSIAKIITRCPQIIGCSINDNLRPTAEYFLSMGVNLTSLLSFSPNVFCQSIEHKLKPVTEFFLDKGYSIDEIGTMARFGVIYKLSLTKNLIPKWDFFLTMGYPMSDLVKYPQYFGYSLEGRIRPRYSQVRKCGVKKVSLSHLFGTSDSKFEKFLNRIMKKGLATEHDSLNVTSDNDLV